MFRSVGSAGHSGDAHAQASVPTETAASWREAEARLFAGLLSRPDLYRDAISVVGETVSRLRQLGSSTGDLMRAAATIATSVRVTVGADKPGLDAIPLEVLGRAALAMRHREVVAEQAAERRLSTLAAGRADAVAWLVLEESGNRSGDPYSPYRRLEADPVTGRGLLVTADPDEAFVASLHSVEVVRVDLGTGGVAAPPDGLPQPSTFATAGEREAYVGRVRAMLSPDS